MKGTNYGCPSMIRVAKSASLQYLKARAQLLALRYLNLAVTAKSRFTAAGSAVAAVVVAAVAVLSKVAPES